MSDDLPAHIEEKREWCDGDCDTDQMGYYHDHRSEEGIECPICKMTCQHGHCDECEKIIGYS